MRVAVLVAVAAAVSTFAGCALYSDRYEVTVVLPGLPEQRHGAAGSGHANQASDAPGVSHYVLRWVAYGSERSRTAQIDERRISLELPKRNNIAVLAYPVTHDGHELKPAGAIAPLGLSGGGWSEGPSGGRLRLRFKSGPPAYLLFRLDRDGRGGAAVNAARLVQEFEERLGPARWRVDWTTLLDAFERGVFRVTMLRAAPMHSVTLGLPPGEYRSADLLAPPVVLSGESEELRLAEGGHRWFSVDGALLASLQVNTDASVAMVVSSRPPR